MATANLVISLNASYPCCDGDVRFTTEEKESTASVHRECPNCGTEWLIDRRFGKTNRKGGRIDFVRWRRFTRQRT